MTRMDHAIRYLPGSSDFLVAAPHGPRIDGRYADDVRTGLVVEEIQSRLGCRAIINDGFLKPTLEIPKSAGAFRLDMFKAGHAAKVPGYLEALRQAADARGHTLVVWVHGIADRVAREQGREHAGAGRFDGAPEELCALIGYGQKRDPHTGGRADRPTVDPGTAGRLRDLLSAGGMTTLLTRRGSRLFRGHHAKRLNQWFVRQGCDAARVESVQLEIRERDFRDSDANARKTGAAVAQALASLY